MERRIPKITKETIALLREQREKSKDIPLVILEFHISLCRLLSFIANNFSNDQKTVSLHILHTNILFGIGEYRDQKEDRKEMLFSLTNEWNKAFTKEVEMLIKDRKTNQLIKKIKDVNPKIKILNLQRKFEMIKKREDNKIFIEKIYNFVEDCVRKAKICNIDEKSLFKFEEIVNKLKNSKNLKNVNNLSSFIKLIIPFAQDMYNNQQEIGKFIYFADEIVDLMPEKIKGVGKMECSKTELKNLMSQVKNDFEKNIKEGVDEIDENNDEIKKINSDLNDIMY